MVFLSLTWIVVVAVASQPPQLFERCQGRIICTDEPLQERVCAAFDGIMDLSRFPVVDVGLTNSRPANADPDTLLVRCEADLPPRPLLNYSFGIMSSSGRFGELDVDTTALDDKCWSPQRSEVDFGSCWELSSPQEKLRCALDAAPQIRVLLNRDMSGNLFHFFYNTVFPLFRLLRALNVTLRDESVVPLVIDSMELPRFQRDVFSALTGSDTRLKHWFWRPFPCRQHMCRLCEPALLLGGTRHWRSWLHAHPGPALAEFAEWIRESFGLLQAAPERPSTILVVDRRKTRSITNVKPLAVALAKSFPAFSVKIVHFEDMLIRQQLEAVGRAAALIGVHGAALSFVPFLPPSGLAVELQPHLGSSELFSQLAEAGSRQLYVVPANATLQSADTLARKAPMSSPLVVDVEQVLAVLQSALETEE